MVKEGFRLKNILFFWFKADFNVKQHTSNSNTFGHHYLNVLDMFICSQPREKLKT